MAGNASHINEFTITKDQFDKSNNFGPEGVVPLLETREFFKLSREEFEYFLRKTALALDPDLREGWLRRIDAGLLEQELGNHDTYDVQQELAKLRDIANPSVTQKFLRRTLSLVSYDLVVPESVGNHKPLDLYEDLFITDAELRPEITQGGAAGIYALKLFAEEERLIRLHIYPEDQSGMLRQDGNIHPHYAHCAGMILTGGLANTLYELEPTDGPSDWALYDVAYETETITDEVRPVRTMTKAGNLLVTQASSHAYEPGDHYNFATTSPHEVAPIDQRPDGQPELNGQGGFEMLKISPIHPGATLNYHKVGSLGLTATLYNWAISPYGRQPSKSIEPSDGPDVRRDVHDVVKMTPDGESIDELLTRADRAIRASLAEIEKPSTILNRQGHTTNSEIPPYGQSNYPEQQNGLTTRLCFNQRSTGALIAWMAEAGIENPVPEEKLHATILFSDSPIQGEAPSSRLSTPVEIDSGGLTLEFWPSFTKSENDSVDYHLIARMENTPELTRLHAIGMCQEGATYRFGPTHEIIALLKESGLDTERFLASIDVHDPHQDILSTMIESGLDIDDLWSRMEDPTRITPQLSEALKKSGFVLPDTKPLTETTLLCCFEASGFRPHFTLSYQVSPDFFEKHVERDASGLVSAEFGYRAAIPAPEIPLTLHRQDGQAVERNWRPPIQLTEEQFQKDIAVIEDAGYSLLRIKDNHDAMEHLIRHVQPETNPSSVFLNEDGSPLNKEQLLLLVQDIERNLAREFAYRIERGMNLELLLMEGISMPESISGTNPLVHVNAPESPGIQMIKLVREASRNDDMVNVIMADENQIPRTKQYNIIGGLGKKDEKTLSFYSAFPGDFIAPMMQDKEFWNEHAFLTTPKHLRHMLTKMEEHLQLREDGRNRPDEQRQFWKDLIEKANSILKQKRNTLAAGGPNREQPTSKAQTEGMKVDTSKKTKKHLPDFPGH